MGSNAAIVKAIYEAMARGDVPAVLGAFDPEIEWYEAEGNPLEDGNPYRGGGAVASGVFKRLIDRVDRFSATPANVIDGGDTVVVEGRYRGQVKGSDRQVDSQFAHVWHLRNGKVVRFQQYTDTKQWAEIFR